MSKTISYTSRDISNFISGYITFNEIRNIFYTDNYILIIDELCLLYFTTEYKFIKQVKFRNTKIINFCNNKIYYNKTDYNTYFYDIITNRSVLISNNKYNIQCNDKYVFGELYNNGNIESIYYTEHESDTTNIINVQNTKSIKILPMANSNIVYILCGNTINIFDPLIYTKLVHVADLTKDNKYVSINIDQYNNITTYELNGGLQEIRWIEKIDKEYYSNLRIQLSDIKYYNRQIYNIKDGFIYVNDNKKLIEVKFNGI